MKIAIVGTGHVGLAHAALLAQHRTVVVLGREPALVEQINLRQTPTEDAQLRHHLATQPLKLRATLSPADAYLDAAFVVIALPTHHDPHTHQFNTCEVDEAIRAVIAINPQAVVVIKSNVPVGFTAQASATHGTQNLLFSPEFLREGHALQDSLYPSRIVVGENTERARAFAALLQAGAAKPNIPTLFTGPSEAEAIKLFANTYLAMRVAFFNELDSYTASRNLATADVIGGVCLDPRVGPHYNNPGFGYGGYSLPKDEKQIRANQTRVPPTLVQSIVSANTARKDHVAADILLRAPQTVGIYRLVMEPGSTNLAASSVQAIMKRLKAEGVRVIVFEPLLTEEHFFHSPVLTSLSEFKQQADLIVANRPTPELQDVVHKVYTRNLQPALN